LHKGEVYSAGTDSSGDFESGQEVQMKNPYYEKEKLFLKY